jgi:thiosulfate dehydrogenase (quinone) large subunit
VCAPTGTRPASLCGLPFMLTLLVSSDYPGAAAPFWQYFGASLSHSDFALRVFCVPEDFAGCFAALLLGRSNAVWSVTAWRTSK